MNGSAGWGRIVPSLPAGPGRPAITWACLLVRRSARAICGGAVSIRPYVSRISAKPWSHRRTSCSVCCAPALAILTWPVPVTLRNGRRTASIPPERRPPMSRRDSISLAVCSMGRYWAPVAADYEVLSTSQYQAWYPEHGGNLDIAVGGDVVGDQWAEKLTSSDPIRPLPPALQSATGSGARAALIGKECRRPGGSISAAMCVARRRCSLSGRLHRFRHSGRRQSQHANRR